MTRSVNNPMETTPVRLPPTEDRSSALALSPCSPPLKRRGKYAPINPVALSTDGAAPNETPHDGEISRSGIAGDNSELLENAARLWICPNDVVVDVTYGRGAFWKRLPGLPTHKHDIKIDGIDCRKLPYDDATLDVVVIDPPYRPTHGSKSFGQDNGLAAAYALGGTELDTINDVLTLYGAALKEAARVIKPGGRVMVKCQDLSYGHRLHLVTLDVLRLMLEAGFDLADQYVLVNATQLSSGKWEKQERARRSHSVLWVGLRLGLANDPS